MTAGITTETYTEDNLLSGDFPRATRGVTIESGQNLVRGSVLGRVTASGEYKISVDGAADGSEEPIVILAEAVDASDAAAESVVYLTGQFNEDRINLDASHDLDTVRDSLRDLSIFLEPAVTAADPA